MCRKEIQMVLAPVCQRCLFLFFSGLSGLPYLDSELSRFRFLRIRSNIYIVNKQNKQKVVCVSNSLSKSNLFPYSIHFKKRNKDFDWNVLIEKQIVFLHIFQSGLIISSQWKSGLSHHNGNWIG
uniref:Uncharacterized protein n=1 Tax=Thalassia hemprichii TaxID=55496 RepID=A0A4Y1KCF9_9LILI|nr:hypothetical protein [Thalassia hemprichii]ATP74924.1 hypothetical protein [Thalassia hemprichii]